jgi:hypothetical protein
MKIFQLIRTRGKSKNRLINSSIKITLNYSQMKKLSLLLMPLCLLFVLSSCKKHSPSTNVAGTITVTIGGSNQTFNVGAVAHADNTGGFYSLSLIGVQSAASANSILMAITTSSPITAGTYTRASSEANISYTQTSGSIYQFDDSQGTSASIGSSLLATLTCREHLAGHLL